MKMEDKDHKEEVEGEEEETEEEEEESEEEEEEEEDQTSEKKEKPTRSDIAQKIKWRDRAQKEAEKVEKLQKELETLSSQVKKPTTDEESRAQEYIRTQAQTVFKELMAARAKEEETKSKHLEDEIELLLDDNPEVSEAQLLSAMKEYEVEPKVALRIIKKSETIKGTKPNMPKSKRATAEKKAEQKDDGKKSMWEIAKEEIAKVAS